MAENQQQKKLRPNTKFLGSESQDKILKEYIRGKEELKAVQLAEELGYKLKKNGFTITKLRGFFNEVVRYDIKGEATKANVLMLKPKLAYMVGREYGDKKDVARVFKKIMEIMIDELLSDDQIDKDKYKRFSNFLKSVVAYHKYYGGK